MTTLTIEQLNHEIVCTEAAILAKQSEIESLQKEIDFFEYEMSESDFDEILDSEGEQHTSVGSFYPSDILKSCDPIAYRCAKSDYESNYDLNDCKEYQDLLRELETLESELSELEDELSDLQNELDQLESE